MQAGEIIVYSIVVSRGSHWSRQSSKRANQHQNYKRDKKITCLAIHAKPSTNISVYQTIYTTILVRMYTCMSQLKHIELLLAIEVYFSMST